ncbi:MAG TPA: aspartyl/asparaginyl beta-hydroxylase domain-containing protein [Steroidobacteraceae bacterium]|nr:aspartyl/asparaginyl beta-hydroxylase domain-containing protein [Steroidobacteraceae bacterium]
MNAAVISESEARALADAINQVSANQTPAEALKLVEMALARAPRQPLVLNAAGGHMQRIGDLARARELFKNAIAVDGKSRVLWLNLARVCRALGDHVEEEVALERVLGMEPRYVPALLQKGDLMERLGRPKAAAIVYGAAIDCLDAGAQVGPQLEPVLARARAVRAESDAALNAFLDEELARPQQQHRAEDLQRFQACHDIYLGKRQIYYSQPKALMFPYLQALEFFPRTLFPWLPLLEAAAQDIAAEALAVLDADRAEFRPYIDSPESAPIDQWRPLNHSLQWSVYHLLHDGKPIPAHMQKCPKTAAVLQQLPLCDIERYAPGAYFSVLQPHTRLPPHTGTTNTRSIVHLPLVIPPGCGFRVGSQTREWRRGEAWVFDDSIEHEAWNDSDQVRIILLFDIWNPLLTHAEQDMVRALTIGIGRFYGDEGPELGSR